MWSLEKTDEFDRRYKWFAKKRPRELNAMLDNLDTLQTAINEHGLNPAEAWKMGFVHTEQAGVLAIDQKGGSGGVRLSQARLYVVFRKGPKVIHLLTIGGKDTQSADVEYARKAAAALLKADTDDQTEEIRQHRGGDQGHS